MLEGGPVEEVVHDALVPGGELVELVHQHDARHAARRRVAELALQQVQRLRGRHALALERLPEQRVGLVWVGDLHAVDLDEDEVVELVGAHGRVEVRDDLADGGGLAGARGAGDVDAGAGAVGDGGFEVGVDEAEFGFAAGEGGGDGGDVELGAGELVGGGVDVGGGEDAGGEGGEFEVFFDEEAPVGGGGGGLAGAAAGLTSAAGSDGDVSRAGLFGGARRAGGVVAFADVGGVELVVLICWLVYSSAFPPAGCLGLAADHVVQGVDVFSAVVDILPHELVRVGACASIAPTAADKDFPVLARFSRDLAGRVFGHECGLGHDAGAAVDGGQGVDVEGGGDVELSLDPMSAKQTASLVLKSEATSRKSVLFLGLRISWADENHMKLAAFSPSSSSWNSHIMPTQASLVRSALSSMMSPI